MLSTRIVDGYGKKRRALYVFSFFLQGRSRSAYASLSFTPVIHDERMRAAGGFEWADWLYRLRRTRQS